MEALIHHFKLWTEGFPAPDGSIYQAVESPHGELGVLLAGDGGAKPRRCHWRTPSFDNLSVLPKIVKRRILWRTWLPSLLLSTLCSEILTDESGNKISNEVKQILSKYPLEHKRSAVMPLLYLAQRRGLSQ